MKPLDSQDGARSIVDRTAVEQPHIAFVIAVLATVVLALVVAIINAVDESALRPRSGAAVFPAEIIAL
jgi:hypothetical protein